MLSPLALGVPLVLVAPQPQLAAARATIPCLAPLLLLVVGKEQLVVLLAVLAVLEAALHILEQAALETRQAHHHLKEIMVEMGLAPVGQALMAAAAVAGHLLLAQTALQPQAVMAEMAPHQQYRDHL